MRVFVEFTHQNGRKRPRGSSSEPVLGELRTVELRTATGSYKVATLHPDNVTQRPLAELYDVKLYCIATQGMHLRGMERIGPEGDERFVLQGWLITDERDHWSTSSAAPAGPKSLE